LLIYGCNIGCKYLLLYQAFPIALSSISRVN
jgi:hypothetical protein